ncbi:MAG: putative transport system permease protein [Clostridiales bacterium]|nr:putative transport system permease protein [Clostridiales bacterium]
MNIYQGFRLAIKSIVSNKMRSILTMLGMIIGVGSVIIIAGLMQGVSNYIVDSFSDMGVNMISVNVTSTGTRHVDEEDMFQFVSDNSDIFEGVSPLVTSSFTIKNGTSTIDSETITGTAETYEAINTLTLSSGRYISYADVANRKSVCVLGTYVISELFDNNNVLGKTVKINGETFTIIGIVEETADGEESSADDCVYVPYTKLARMSFIGTISSYSFATYGREYVTDGESLLDDFLYEKLLDEDLYRISSMTSLLNTIDDMMAVLSNILSGIAGISLLVAGIGIMNIMLVSVTERTQEIGIRKSLGARRRDILTQFIIEAGSISALGGFIGILLGSTFVIYAGSLFGVNASPSLSSILLSFSISVGIGLIFGYMPARKAARLNPIDALRSE